MAFAPITMAAALTRSAHERAKLKKSVFLPGTYVEASDAASTSGDGATRHRPPSPNHGGHEMRFMLLQNYGEVESDSAPMTEWTPEDIKAHIEFQHALNQELTERGDALADL